jgi:pyridoxal phosphate enzyme (YggS family)
MTEPADRAREIAANWAALQQRIAAACVTAGRSPGDVTVIAVTKTFPASDVLHLAALGVRDVGENRADEADDKEDEVRSGGVSDLTWHFVGQLQTNKAGLVAARMDVVHSVDREKLVVALDRAADRAGRRISCLVQVDLALDDPGRGGAAPSDVRAIADAVAASDLLDLGGLMAVAPLGGDPGEAFARLELLASELRTSYPEAVMVSAGMSGDLEAAVEHGATHLRVGTALLGSRPPLG